MEKKLKLREKIRKNVGKIGEKKVEKKRKKNSMVVKNSFMSVQKSPTWREAEKSSKGKKLRKEFEKI